MLFFSDEIQNVFTQVIWWVLSNYIEILATITGLIYLIYSVKGNILLWVFGLITSLLYVFVFYQAKIYADMGVNIYYVIISIYGWIHWSKSMNNTKELPVIKINFRMGLMLLLTSILIFVLIAFVLKKFTDSDIAFWDAFTTSLSVIATWMLARKILEHWIIWIVVDAVSVGLYVYKGLYPTVFLFIVYSSLAIMGYIEWHKKWKTQKVKY